MWMLNHVFVLMILITAESCLKVKQVDPEVVAMISVVLHNNVAKWDLTNREGKSRALTSELGFDRL